MTAPERMDIRALVSGVLKSYGEGSGIIKIESAPRISKSEIIETISDLQMLVFPGFFGEKTLRADSVEYFTGELVERLFQRLKTQISHVLADPERIAYAFLANVPKVRALLATDVEASFDGDPAACSRDEVVLSYPGIYAVMANRLAHELYALGVPLIPRMMTEYAHDRTGVDIHPGATIGHHFFIDHGTGIVIGETAIIGNHVKIYQGVTLGALSTRGGQLLQGVKRHPTIEDHVTIYSGASILGGGTVIGEGVVVGSNAFIVKSVPERTKVSVKNPELQYAANEAARPKELEQREFWDWVI